MPFQFNLQVKRKTILQILLRLLYPKYAIIERVQNGLILKIREGWFWIWLSKSLSVAAVLLSSAFVLAACGGNSKNWFKRNYPSSYKHKLHHTSSGRKFNAPLKDGTYELVSEADKRGWQEFTITVEGGKITKSDYDNLNDKGERKSLNAEYEKAMKDAGYWPKQNTSALTTKV